MEAFFVNLVSRIYSFLLLACKYCWRFQSLMELSWEVGQGLQYMVDSGLQQKIRYLSLFISSFKSYRFYSLLVDDYELHTSLRFYRAVMYFHYFIPFNWWWSVWMSKAGNWIWLFISWFTTLSPHPFYFNCCKCSSLINMYSCRYNSC